MDTSIINRLADRLREYKEIDLNGAFEKVRVDAPNLSVLEQNRLKEMDAFDRQLELKRLVGERLEGSFEEDQVNEWIVHKWGGITTFDLSNRERITGFRDHLVAGQITRQEFGRISSLSKIASFVNPGGYFVYDSRVAFALDGLLLDLLRTDSRLRVRFFPLPSALGGRDEVMRKMIAQEYPGAEYLAPVETYTEYNGLIPALAETEQLKKDLPSCWLEMLLFYLGRTGGEIEKMFDFSSNKAAVKKVKKKQAKAGTSKKQVANSVGNKGKQVLPLITGQKIRGRVVLAGYDIPFGERWYNLFVGIKGKYHFIGLLTRKGSETLDDGNMILLLERRGLNRKGKDYIYRRLEPYDEASARVELEALKSVLTDGGHKH